MTSSGSPGFYTKPTWRGRGLNLGTFASRPSELHHALGVFNKPDPMIPDWYCKSNVLMLCVQIRQLHRWGYNGSDNRKRVFFYYSSYQTQNSANLCYASNFPFNPFHLCFDVFKRRSPNSYAWSHPGWESLEPVLAVSHTYRSATHHLVANHWKTWSWMCKPPQMKSVWYEVTQVDSTVHFRVLDL